MVSTNRYHIQMRETLMQMGQKAIEHLPTPRPGVGGIEQITRDQQGINLPLGNQVAEPVEKTEMFMGTVVPMQMMAKMPVGGMQDFHAGVQLQVFTTSTLNSWQRWRQRADFSRLAIHHLDFIAAGQRVFDLAQQMKAVPSIKLDSINIQRTDPHIEP